MTYGFAPPFLGSVSTSSLLIDAARCWRNARDAGWPAQPSLAGILREHCAEMLAPCLDSLMSLSQAALGRPFRVGKGGAISTDEHLLLDLVAGAKPPPACLDCPREIATALDCALCSTRIMITMEQAESQCGRADDGATA